MEYRFIGNSDLKLSAVTFGAWALGGWMWGGTEKNESAEAIHAAFDEGVTSFDTAPIYGQGHSEKIIGNILNDFPRDQIQILTKYGMRWDIEKGELAMSSKNNEGDDIDIYRYAGKESVIKECEDSLQRLKTDYIDLYQIHWPDPTTPVQETMEAVRQLKEEGKIRHTAVCNYSSDQLKEADNYADIISDQVPYSMLRRDIEEELVPYCTRNNKGILAYSPLQRGLLTGKMNPGQHFNEGDTRADSSYFRDHNIKKTNSFLNKIRDIGNKHDATLAQLVIRWTLDQPGITVALVGARNAKQAIQNARAVSIELSDQEINDIDEELNKLSLEL